MYMHMYIYIYRERERETHTEGCMEDIWQILADDMDCTGLLREMNLGT